MNSPHLDDERLSAHLDGEDDAAAEHLAMCPSCRARLDAFREVARLVGAPVPAAPAGRADAAVATALQGASARSAVVPLSTARRRRRTQIGLAAAAAVALVLGAVSLVGGDDAGDNGDAASTSQALGPDLGDQSDATALAERVRTAVEGVAAEAMAPAEDSADASTSGGSVDDRAESSGEAGSAAPASARRAMVARSVRPGGPCTGTATSEYGRGLGELVFQGTLRWDGTPAVILAYRIEGATGPLDHRVLVLARDDCRLLVAQTI
ncbi:MAG: hypothetical protein KY443_02800 [Actinobacteria bacterium]|nr:hypothetical protein [Actinomycetota bacterium]